MCPAFLFIKHVLHTFNDFVIKCISFVPSMPTDDYFPLFMAKYMVLMVKNPPAMQQT